MTYREAMAQIHREMGLTDEQIKEKEAFADRQNPTAAKMVDSEIQLKPGMTLEQFLTQLKVTLTGFKIDRN